MIKTLTPHGNSAALIIDKPILELLHIGMETPLEIVTDGKVLIISPVGSVARGEQVDKALERVNAIHGETLARLAE